MDYTRETAAQRARLDKVMHAPACSGGSCRQDSRRCPSPDACQLPVQFADEPSEFFDWITDLASAGRIVLICLLVVVACGLAAYLVGVGICAIEPYWPLVVAALGV